MKISVCMATYNGGKYLREQMDSILGQEFKENKDVQMEVIVSDDGSNDDTIDILKSYSNDIVRIVHHKKSGKHKYYNETFYVKSNFENAIKYATGDYIFLSDQDDVWYPWKLDKSLTALRGGGGSRSCI